MYYTYVLFSEKNPDVFYVGYTKDLKKRIDEHNNGCCRHSNMYKPWQLYCYFAFPVEKLAIDFEKYLKSGSGRTFAKRHFAIEYSLSLAET